MQVLIAVVIAVVIAWTVLRCYRHADWQRVHCFVCGLQMTYKHAYTLRLALWSSI